MLIVGIIVVFREEQCGYFYFVPDDCLRALSVFVFLLAYTIVVKSSFL